MGGYSLSLALVLEVYHILRTSVSVNWTIAQLLRIMSTQSSREVRKMKTTIASFIAGTTSSCADWSKFYTGLKVYFRIGMDLRTIYFALKPIRRSMDKTRNIVLAVSGMEQSKIGLKNFLCFICKWRVLSAFYPLKTMLYIPLVNY
jgi:hypothetical protein